MLKEILSLFLTSSCCLCEGKTRKVICSYCENKLLSCQVSQPYYLITSDFFLFAWGRYDSYLKRAIANLKYDNYKDIGYLMGTWLGQKWLEDGYKKKYPQLTVIPIPLHEKKLKMRGFNQAELIARGFCEKTGYSVKTELLSRVKDTKAMFGLNPEERETNIRQAFTLGKDYKKINTSQEILIVDDIYTTGATVKEAKAILKSGNLKIIGVATVSVTKYGNSP